MGTSANDPAQILGALFEAGQETMRRFAAPPASDGSPPTDPAAAFLAASKNFAELQQGYLQQMAGFWSGMTGMAPAGGAGAQAGAVDDKRFAGEAWRTDPRFDLIKRTYLAYSDFWQRAVEAAPADDATRAQLRFGMRQFVDAMSPTNFLATNPEAMQLALETGGQSLAQGMTLFFTDLARGRISTTDETAFAIGKSLATTPGSVIFENDLIQVIQYTPATQQVYERPMVMIPPCINKFYILDLQPENSLVRYVVENGHTVFLVSWRNVGEDQGGLTWDDYLETGVLKAIDVALAVSGADQVNTLGFCVGGTMLASAVAVMKFNGDDKVASMTLLTSMLDFSETGEIGTLVSEQSIAAREAAIGNGGLMHGKELAFAFSSLRANDLMWQYVVNGYLKGRAPPAFDMLYWNADGTNLPGPMFCWYVRNTYLENNLREADGTVQCGVPVDLSLVDVPAFLYASRDDHIVPWRTAFASTELLAGETTFVLGASGHIAGVINPAAKKKRNFWAEGADGADPEHWFATAKSVPGSWWPMWMGWLGEYAGAEVPAPVHPGNRKFPAIEPAPGRYVMTKAD